MGPGFCTERSRSLIVCTLSDDEGSTIPADFCVGRPSARIGNPGHGWAWLLFRPPGADRARDRGLRDAGRVAFHRREFKLWRARRSRQSLGAARVWTAVADDFFPAAIHR